jgi:hypothetical protein
LNGNVSTIDKILRNTKAVERIEKLKIRKAGAYQTVLHVMAGLLVVGFLANLSVRPVAQKYWLPERNLKEPGQPCSCTRENLKMAENTKQSSKAMILLAWLLVGVPVAWGVYNTLLNSMNLFQAK